ncbi:MAG: ATP-binding protein [Planctomycetota bacterium]
MTLHPVLGAKLTEALVAPTPAATPRDVRLPAIRNKVHSVIGMRRSGKTTFLKQLCAERRAKAPPECAVYLSFDDERLGTLEVQQLSLLLEEHYRRHSDLRNKRVVTWLLDEIQLVPGWERFVRRILDSELVEVVVSGSSAKMLSREVHTSLRGRGMETEIHPFGFREHLRHREAEPEKPPTRWTAAERSRIEKAFRTYLTEGGFPEAQGLPASVRIPLLQGYVETVMFRDVVERHGITQVAALRWLIRHCLRNPARLLSVHGLVNDLRAQGHPIGKDAVHAMISHLQDAFLFTAVPLATESVRRQNSNPRKVYPVDHGLIAAFDPSGKSNLGHHLEVVVHTELRRRHADVAYVRNEDGTEVDFLVRRPGEHEELIQVCADIGEPATLARELRALESAHEEHPKATRRLLLGERTDTKIEARGVIVQTIPEWLLEPIER